MALYGRLLEFLKPYWLKLVLAMVFMSLVAAMNGLTAFLVKPVLDKIFFEKNAQMLYLIPVGVILLYLVKGIFEYLQAYLMGYVGQRVITDIRNLVFSPSRDNLFPFLIKLPPGQVYQGSSTMSPLSKAPSRTPLRPS